MRMLTAVACTVVLAVGMTARAEEAVDGKIAEACIAKLAQIANRPAADIAASAVAPDGDGQVVTLDLNGAENAWLCHVDAGGNVVDVIYQGEG